MKDLLLRGKFSDGEPLRGFGVYSKMTFILRRGFFVTGTICARAVSVTEVDVWEGSIAIWVRAKVIEIDAKQVLRVVRPAS